VGFALLLLTPIAMFFWRLSSRSRSTPKTEPTAAWGAAFATLAVLLILGLIAAQLADGYHLLGTDKVGQDVLYLGIKSIRTGVLIGTLTLLVMLPLALVMGTAAGYFGGRIDDAVQYLYTTLSSIPGVLLIAAAVLSVNLYLDQNLAEVTSLHQRADLRLLLLTGILGLTGWIGLCRLLRAESLKLRELDYVTAARAFGVRDLRILGRHLLPNLGHLVLITVVIDFSGLVLAEAVLSYVGVGVDPSMISWGNMINSARLELAREPAVWWSLATAFVFMFTLVLCANLFADAVRDALDPRLRGTQ
jgi:peptide/nickel transport system permease protein